MRYCYLKATLLQYFPLFISIDAKQLPVSTNTVPEFEIIQETTSYRVFVLDTSGSMKVICRYFFEFLTKKQIYLHFELILDFMYFHAEKKVKNTDVKER
jgi:hypothetical protein